MVSAPLTSARARALIVRSTESEHEVGPGLQHFHLSMEILAAAP